MLIDSLKLTVKFGKYELINHELANLWIWSWKIVISLVLCIPLRRLGVKKNSPNFTKLAEIFFFSDGLHGDDQGYGGIGPIGRR